jgi:predicted nucleic acid-binding protein
MSFVIMRRRNIFEALAHDEHFRQAGFLTLIDSS